MSDVVDLAQQRTMQEAHRRDLFDRFVEAKRYADLVETHEAHDYAARAYRAFHRAYLTDPERRAVELEAENAHLRSLLRAHDIEIVGDAASGGAQGNA